MNRAMGNGIAGPVDLRDHRLNVDREPVGVFPNRLDLHKLGCRHLIDDRPDGKLQPVPFVVCVFELGQPGICLLVLAHSANMPASPCGNQINPTLVV